MKEEIGGISKNKRERKARKSLSFVFSFSFHFRVLLPYYCLTLNFVFKREYDSSFDLFSQQQEPYTEPGCIIHGKAELIKQNYDI